MLFSLSLWEPAACREQGFALCFVHMVSLVGKADSACENGGLQVPVTEWLWLILANSVNLATTEPHPLAQHLLLVKPILFLSLSA